MRNYIIGAMLAVFGTTSFAASSGLEVSLEAERRDTGWKSMSARVQMVLLDREGNENSREFNVRYLEMKDDGDRSIVVFDRPADIKGIGLLTWSHSVEPDNQWLYLPAVERVKRISSKNKSGPFVASEFAYEDITSNEVDKYEHKLLTEESCGDKTCFLIERTPNYKHSGYSKLVVWIDQQHYRTQRVEYYDRKGVKLKTLQYEKYNEYESAYWRSHEMFMENHQSGKTTRLMWTDIEFGSDLSSQDFQKAALDRLR